MIIAIAKKREILHISCEKARNVKYFSLFRDKSKMQIIAKYNGAPYFDSDSRSSMMCTVWRNNSYSSHTGLPHYYVPLQAPTAAASLHMEHKH